MSSEQFQKDILKRIGKSGVLLSDMIRSLELVEIRTSDLTPALRELEANDVIRITEGYVVPGGSFQVLLQKVITLKDGTRGVEHVERVARKRKTPLRVEDDIETEVDDDN